MGYSQHLHYATDLERIVHSIVEAAHPQRVILFGSRSRGEAGPDSDLDMLIVVEDARERHGLAVRIREAIGQASVPVDIVIRDARELQQRSRLPGSVERSAVREGITLYAA
jgi:predicted nucleotidyltransferase